MSKGLDYIQRHFSLTVCQAEARPATAAGRPLRQIVGTTGGRQVASRKLSRRDIAKMVGASCEMMSRVVKDLELRWLTEAADGRNRLARARQEVALALQRPARVL